MLSRFLAMLCLYTGVMLVGNMHFRGDDVRLTGQNARTLVAAMQVGIVSVVLFIHTLFMFFIRVVKHERITFVLVSSRTSSVNQQHGNYDPRFNIEDLEPELARGPHVESQGKNAEMETTPCKAVSDDRSSERFDARSEQLSDASETLPVQVVFERSVNLDLYFLYVTFVGLVLWCTFLSFNFSTYDSNYIVICGLVLGWIGNTLSRECRCHESIVEPKTGGKMRVLCYSFLGLLIMCLGSLQWRVPTDMESTAANFYLPALCSGLFWTGLSHEVAFTGVQNVSRGILYDARRSVPTFLLVATVSALCCSPETCERVFEYIASLSRLAAVHLLLVEPILIFLSLYIMIIALERQRSTDLGIALVLVEGFFIAYHRQTHDAAVFSTVAASVLLFAAHTIHLARS